MEDLQDNAITVWELLGRADLPDQRVLELLRSYRRIVGPIGSEYPPHRAADLHEAADLLERAMSNFARSDDDEDDEISKHMANAEWIRAALNAAATQVEMDNGL